MALLDRTPAEDGPLARLKARQEQEDAAYEQALAALDRLASFPLPAEQLKDLPAELEAINRLWSAPEAEATTARGFLDRRATEALRPAISRQQEWNANVVRILNGFIAEETKAVAHLREISAALIQYAQRLLPTADARDRLSSGYATLRSEMILEAFDRRLESLQMRIDGFKGLVDRVEVIGAEVRAVRETLANSAPGPEAARDAVEAAQSSSYAAFENTFRRSDDALASRFAGYAQAFSGIPQGSVILDLGCGRGEFLQALAQAGHKGRGVESNASAVYITAGDEPAARCIDTFAAMGVRIPEHLSVIGWDDIGVTAKTGRRPSSVGYDKYAMGREAALMLMDLMKRGNEVRSRGLVVPTRVNEYDTTTEFIEKKAL